MATIKDDLKNFRLSWVHHTGMQLATLSVLAATFSVIVFGLALSMNLKRVLSSWGDALQITVYLKDDLGDDEMKQLQVELESLRAVKSVSFVPREAATENFKGQMASYAPDLLTDADFANPFPASFKLSLKGGFSTDEEVRRIEAMAASIQKMNGVEDVSYGQSWVKNYTSFVSALYASSGVLAAIMILGSLFVVGNSIRASISARREEIEILELVGATSSMIRRPFVFEGAVMGALAATLAIVLNFILHFWQKSVLSSSLVLARLAPVVSFLDFASMLGFVLAGAAIGAFGAWVTVRRINDGWSARQGLET